MSSGATTSRVFAASRRVRDALRFVAFPAAGVDVGGVAVGMSDLDFSRSGEFVQVAPEVGEDGSISWRTLPGGRREEFSIVVRTLTNAGHATEDAALDRIEHLTQIVQRAFYDDTEPAATALVSFDDAQVKSMSPAQVSFTVGQFLPGEFGAVSDVVVPMLFHI